MTSLPHPRVALDVLVFSKRLLIALDFDGTLAHLVDIPDDARMTPLARQAVNDLSLLPGVTVALVSGRGLADLRSVSEADPRWWLIGSHGVELEGPADGGVVQVPTADEHELRALWEGFEEVANRHPGCWLERKPWGAALHTRSLDSDAENRAREDARALIESVGSPVTTRLGHGIIECSLQSQNKGDGLRALAEYTHPDCTLFIGDDLTDEDALAVLGPHDVGVKVGHQETLARYRLPDPDAVALFLAELARAKKGSVET